MGGEEPGHGYGAYSGGGGGGDRSAGQDTCLKCGRPGHWARDCPSMGGGRGSRPFSPPCSRYDASDVRGDRYTGDRDRYVDDRIDRGRYGDRDRYDSRDDGYGNRDRIPSGRYAPVVDRFPVNRYVTAERFPQNGCSRDRAYDRDGGALGVATTDTVVVQEGLHDMIEEAIQRGLLPMTAPGEEVDPLQWSTTKRLCISAVYLDL